MRICLKSIDRRSLAGLPSVTIMCAAAIHLYRSFRRWKSCFLLALLLAPGAHALAFFSAPQHGGMHRAQKHESRREIDQMEEAWRDAMVKADIPAMTSLLADDFIAITPYGTLQTKEEILANLRSGATRITALEIFDRRVRFYGTTALVTSRAEVSGTSGGVEVSGSYRYTRVYVRNAQGKWKIVSFEASRVHEAGERK
jgi:ketosteroid isomerase-like protein